MARVHELRSLARARSRAAGKKISRLKSVHGATVSGSEYDPRKSAREIDRMTSRQLTSYLSRVESFMDRRTQFLSDAHGRPLPALKYRDYVRLNRAYNARVAERQKQHDDVFLSSAGQTVAERRAMRTPAHRGATNPAVNSPMALQERKPQHIASEKGLDVLIKQLKKKNSPGQRRRELRAAKEQMRKMGEVINSPTIMSAIKSLNDSQVEFLWYNTNFATTLSLYYETQLAISDGEEEPWHASIIEGQIEVALSQINDARKV